MTYRNLEKKRAMQREWYAKNKEKQLARMAEYYSNNRERVLSVVKKYKEANPEKVRECRRVAVKRRWYKLMAKEAP